MNNGHATSGAVKSGRIRNGAGKNGRGQNGAPPRRPGRALGREDGRPDGSRRAVVEQALAKLGDIRSTSLASHAGRCCFLAQEWFRAQSRAHHAVSGLPAPWLRARWKWGPQNHPGYWCEVMEQTTIDCSTLAALTCESLRAVGEPVATVQMIEHFDTSSVQNWAHCWREHGGAYWLSGATSYHVAVAVRGGTAPGIRIWNPTVECFSELRPLTGYGSIAAVRVLVEDNSELAPDGVLEWRGMQLRANDWTILSM